MFDVHLVDGTWELFRHHFAPTAGRTMPDRQPSSPSLPARPTYRATRAALGSILRLLEEGATHIGVATDSVVRSFRNEIWPSYKTGDGLPEELTAQFGIFEEALVAMGLTNWAMDDLEADDALASAASVAAASNEVATVFICSPDKDLSQCVVGTRVLQIDRRSTAGARAVIDEAAVRARYSVSPSSIPDWLALVGDSADGFPGLAGWGARSASAILAEYGTIEAIPDHPGQWTVSVRGGARLARTLREERAQAMVFKDLATLRIDPSICGQPREWAWSGPTPGFDAICDRIGAPGLGRRADRLAEQRS